MWTGTAKQPLSLNRVSIASAKKKKVINRALLFPSVYCNPLRVCWKGYNARVAYDTQTAASCVCMYEVRNDFEHFGYIHPLVEMLLREASTFFFQYDFLAYFIFGGRPTPDFQSSRVTSYLASF